MYALPTVNLNGTSEGELIEQRTRVIAHLRGALAAMSDGWPHPRDYPEGKLSYIAACESWQRRRNMLQAVVDGLQQEAEWIAGLRPGFAGDCREDAERFHSPESECSLNCPLPPGHAGPCGDADEAEV